jgi:hypothetical protein
MTAALNRVLVLAMEPVIAALVGMLLETTGRLPVFAEPAEGPTDALERLRPIAIVLVDIEIPDVRSDLFFGAASKWGVRIAVFGHESHAREIAEIAGGRSVPWFTSPPTVAQLRTALDATVGDPRRASQDDRRLTVGAAPDGTRILSDSNGRRWMVYDRRQSSDRRATRVFVSDAGEFRQCGLDDQETRQFGATALGAQLARAR